MQTASKLPIVFEQLPSYCKRLDFLLENANTFEKNLNSFCTRKLNDFIDRNAPYVKCDCDLYFRSFVRSINKGHNAPNGMDVYGQSRMFTLKIIE